VISYDFKLISAGEISLFFLEENISTNRQTLMGNIGGGAIRLGEAQAFPGLKN